MLQMYSGGRVGIKKSEGLVLKKIEYGESNRILHIFSKNFGKIVLDIKGIKKSKRRERAASDNIALSYFVFYEQEDRRTVSSIELVDGFMLLKSDLFKVSVASYLIRFIDFFVVENDKNEELYERTIKAIKYIEKNNNEIEILIMLVYFIKTRIDQEGLLIDSSGNGSYFDIKNGSFTEENQVGCFLVENIEKKAVKMLNKVDISSIYELKLGKKQIVGLIEFFERYLKYHLNYKIKIEEYVEGGFI